MVSLGMVNIDFTSKAHMAFKRSWVRLPPSPLYKGSIAGTLIFFGENRVLDRLNSFKRATSFREIMTPSGSIGWGFAVRFISHHREYTDIIEQMFET